MPEKRAAIGVCDFCGGLIKRDEWYTRRGPRLHCSLTCRQFANSRAGAPIRSRKAKQRVAAGEWLNPASIHPPDPARVAAGISRARKAEVRAGTWRNPALDEKARRKLSRPRKHSGALHRAIEKLRVGNMRTLTDAEHNAWLRYRRELRIKANKKQK